MTKPAQSVLPPPSAQPDASSCYKVASFCTDCRCHLDLLVDFRRADLTERSCPNPEYPLHHFRHVPDLPGPLGPHSQAVQAVQHHFECSSPSCSAKLSIWVKPPRLSARHLSLLTDPAVIRSRVQPVLEAAPDRLRGYAVPEPIQVLSNVRQYLSDAMRDPHPKVVNANNKRFMTSLGEPCRDVLEYLGFKSSEERTAEVCSPLDWRAAADAVGRACSRPGLCHA